jgi:hypothetical protein
VVGVALPQRGQEPGDLRLGYVAEPVDLAEMRQVAPQIAAVRGERVGRDAALDRQVRQVVIDHRPRRIPTVHCGLSQSDSACSALTHGSPCAAATGSLVT